MSKIGTVFRNIAAIILFALALLFICKYVSGTLVLLEQTNKPVTDDRPVTETTDNTESESELELFLKSIPVFSGSRVTDTFDKSSMCLALSDTSKYALSQSFSLSTKTVSVPVRIPDEVFGTYSTVFEDKELERIQIELYDGNIILDRGEKLELYSDSGELISDNFTLAPTFLRDVDGNALYTDKNAYFAIKDNKFVQVDYAPHSLERVIAYENTPELANENDGLSAISQTGEDGTLVALSDADGNLLTNYEYTRIYAFSEGLAAALLPDGSISYIDKSGKVVFEGRDTYRNTSDRHVDRVYAVPDTMGPESVGFLYFDNGIVLIREKTVDYVYKENTISDTCTAVRADGSKLAVPGDYTCVSAADGAVVVEKNGKYGVFGANERWMLQPVYDSIEPYYEGLAVVSKDGSFGLYDTEGNEILPMLFDYISPVSRGRIAAYSAEKGFMIFEKQALNA